MLPPPNAHAHARGSFGGGRQAIGNGLRGDGAVGVDEPGGLAGVGERDAPTGWTNRIPIR
eukprot:1182831-Prorocentrum_minimum.AAC.1